MRYVASLLWIALVVIISANAPPACGQLAAETLAQKTERVLDELTAFDFVDTPLRDVLDYLQDQHKVKIDLARETQRGPKQVHPRTPVTLNLKGVSLRSGLHLLLDRYELEVTVKPDGTLLLVWSTKELKGKRVESEVQKIAHAKLRDKLLNEKANAEFVNTPVMDVIAFLADQAECTIVLDHQALAELGVSSDEPITCLLSEMSLGRLLVCVLAPLDM
jgi:hypothetical protein